jgi:TPR repeat protein
MLEYETARLVLVVDQLEELFTIERVTTGERRRFVDLLAGLVRSDLVWVVATMRKDFWHRADETPELVHLAEGSGRLELLPPGPAQLSQMIRRPAEAAGVSFEVHGTTNVPLNEVIAEEVAREPGALPLLSYLLNQLYRADVLEADGTTLTYATYEKLGKLEGAIATQAEAVLERCAAEDRQALGSVLFSLVEIGAGEGNVERAVARRVPLSTFPAGSAQRRLVEALLDPGARLLVTDTEKGGSPTVRVAHEALISRWAQAREFVQGNAEALKIRHRIEERYVLWHALNEGSLATQPGTSPSLFFAARHAAWRSRFGREQGLLTDIDLTDGRRLLKEHRTDTEPHLVAYIEHSAADHQRIRTRSFRVLAVVATVVAVLAIVALGAGGLASRRQHEAEYQAAQTLKAQARLLTEAAAQRLKDSDMRGAQGVILEVLTNPEFAQGHAPAAISVFQEIRAADAQLAVLGGHGDVSSAAYSPDGTRIVTASIDKTARVWDARIPADIAAQILWDAAAQTDPLPDVDRTQLGLLPDTKVRTGWTHASACDQAAAAFYDPDRLAPGLAQATIVADVANSACSAEMAKSGNSPRGAYQTGRTLLAKSEVKGARQQFERAASEGYRAARIDLANLLVDASAGKLDPERAVSLYQKAWQDGVPIAAFALGHLYEVGVSGWHGAREGKLPPDLAKAWGWYQKGADVGEPDALARFAERDERNAIAETDPQKRDVLLLQAFRFYAAASERAHDEDWPDEAWRDWRYRRATLARLLARDGMMQQVADAYQTERDRRNPAPTMWQSIAARLHL